MVRPETQVLHDMLKAEYDHITEPYEDGTGRADGYWITLYEKEDLITLHYGDDGGYPHGDGRAIWIDIRGERAEIDIEESALWDGTSEQRLMFERVREQRVRDMMSDDWKARQSCGVWVCNVGEPCDVA